MKSRIRVAAEKEEQDFYRRRAPAEWLEALRPLGTDEHKPYLEIAPWLIAVFLRRFSRLPDGRKVKHYYTDESVGIAVGYPADGATVPDIRRKPLDQIASFR